MSAWTFDVVGRIGIATFTRPPRNFMSFATIGELARLLEDVAARQDVRVLLVTGGVEGYFVAHADVDDLSRLGSGQPVAGDPRDWARSMRLLETIPQPVVAAVNGQAWGGGCELALACTLRVASEAAHFGQPEVNVGIIPGAGGTQRLPRLVGQGRAAELILSGRVVDANEAYRIGLVQTVLPTANFLERAMGWAEPIAAKPFTAVAAAKRAIVEGTRRPFDEGLRLEAELFLSCQTGQEALELQRQALARYAAAGDDERVEL